MTEIVIKTKKGYDVVVYTESSDRLGGYEVGVVPLSGTSIVIKKQISWGAVCKELKNYLKGIGWKEGGHAHIFCTDNEGVVVEDWSWDRQKALKIYKKLKEITKKEA